MTVRKVSRKISSKTAPAGRISEAPPTGISPILRASWRFARKTAQRFSRELIKDRVDQFLKKLSKRFV